MTAVYLRYPMSIVVCCHIGTSACATGLPEAEGQPRRIRPEQARMTASKIVPFRYLSALIPAAVTPASES